ncbi:MAG: TonB-dependent receptor [Sandaracinaceae bacterium]|nr:TonB-dependent receptor [Sandaracinaceae bacterium]
MTGRTRTPRPSSSLALVAGLWTACVAYPAAASDTPTGGGARRDQRDESTAGEADADPPGADRVETPSDADPEGADAEEAGDADAGPPDGEPSFGATTSPRDPDDEPSFGATAEVARRLPSANGLDPTAAGTRVDLRARTAAGENVVDVLPELPGSQLQSLGGMGAFAGLGLRGGDASQTEVVLDDLPIHDIDDGAFDFSLLPLDAFHAIEVYRGGAPAALNVAPMGGVVRLIPASVLGTRMVLRGNAGSYLTGGGSLEVGLRRGNVEVLALAGARGSRSNYPYLDDGNTRFDYTDDVRRRVRNAEALDTSTFFHVRAQQGEWVLRAVLLTITRDAGVPGPLSAPSLQTERLQTQLRGVLGVSRSWEGRAQPRLSLQGILGGRRNRFEDRLGEIGSGPHDTDDRSRSWRARSTLTLSPADALDTTLVLDAAGYRYDPEDAASRFEEPTSRRETVAGTLELHAHGGRGGRLWSLRPSVRVQGSFGHTEELRLGRIQSHTARSALPTFRVGAAFSPLGALSITASVFRGARLPTQLELFGDRAMVRENPELRPETGMGGDLGLLLQTTGDVLCARLELRGHARRDEDLIRARRTSQSQSVFENVASAWVAGLESSGDLQVGQHLQVTGMLSYLYSRDTLGNALPYRARTTAFLRAQLGTGRLRSGVVGTLYADVRHQGRLYADAANLVAIPARVWLGVGARVTYRGLELALSVRDLRNRAGSDVLGYALPGRRVAVSAVYTKEWE